MNEQQMSAQFKNDMIHTVQNMLGIQKMHIISDLHSPCPFKRIEIDESISPETPVSLVMILDLMNNFYDDYKRAHNAIDRTYVIEKITDYFIYLTLLHEPHYHAYRMSKFRTNISAENMRPAGANDEMDFDVKRYITSDKTYKSILLLKNFLTHLNYLATQTYESRSTTVSFLIFKDDARNCREFLDGLGIDYIPLEKDELTLNDINNYSKANRLVDSLSISYVVNEQYDILGFARKRHRAVKDILLTANDSEKHSFVYLENRKIYWVVQKDLIVVYDNGQWKVKDYSVISMLLQVMYANTPNDAIYAAHFAKSVIKDLSMSNTGALFIFLTANMYSNECKKLPYSDAQVFHFLTRHDVKNTQGDVADTYKKILLNGHETFKLSDPQLDSQLVKLIADVDGAIIIDSNMNLMSFGEMIVTQNLLDVHVHRLINGLGTKMYTQQNDTKSFRGGARSLAALNASTYGLAIKVSEDGDISIYYRRELKWQI